VLINAVFSTAAFAPAALNGFLLFTRSLAIGIRAWPACPAVLCATFTGWAVQDGDLYRKRRSFATQVGLSPAQWLTGRRKARPTFFVEDRIAGGNAVFN